MGQIIHWFRNLFKLNDTVHTDEDLLRIEFKTRYHHFKLLINANSNALDNMGEIEQALLKGKPFSMAFVRSQCTEVIVNILNMIKHMERLAPEKYPQLREKFDTLQQIIKEHLNPINHKEDLRLIIPIKETHRGMVNAVGKKMAVIGELSHLPGIHTPKGFVITSEAYHLFLRHNDLKPEINELHQKVDPKSIVSLFDLSSKIQQLIISSKVPVIIENAVEVSIDSLEKNEKGEKRYAIRSSALGEDLVDSSFAGMYRSELNVSKENINEAFKTVLASKYSLQATAYRFKKGIRDEDTDMCIGVLEMIDAIAGGVMYTQSPIAPFEHAIFIHATPGLPKSVVDGSDACDIFVTSKGSEPEILREEIKVKRQKYVCYPKEGILKVDLLEDEAKKPSLTKALVIELSKIADKIEKYYDAPQDIEWAVNKENKIIIVQSRPLRQYKKERVENSSVLPTDTKDLLLKGDVCASMGVGFGPVHRVSSGSDMLHFPKKGVLVIEKALPRWAPLLGQAKAVISEEGSFAGHLANVAREFNIPAIFGCSDAMTVLKSGEMVTVDAEAQTVYKGKKESVLKKAPAKPVLTEKSPIYQLLKTLSRYIVPLNLLDPETPQFKAQNCETLHDITRFIHEKAVHEMFRFGKDNRFMERSSKQLYYNVPMQWWVLNLDDGFIEETKGKYIRLENIASIPMLVFWEGFAAIPWDGPPALDGKGLMSVMFQSTTNRALVPGMKSNYTHRNYFIISKNFCNLSSRLGYHFSTLEAYISDRYQENYISYQFKGGATDFERRRRRLRFIADLLEAHDFSLEITADHLSARIRGGEMDYIKSRVKILGYLTLHTRQLDMIMSDPNKVTFYQNKLNADIETLK